MDISVIGAGYVGLVTSACLADKGHQVVCVDIAEDKVNRINEALSPIHEAGLAELLRANVPSRLRATTDITGSIATTDTTFIAVGTPFDGKEIDLTYVRDAAHQVGSALRKKHTYHLVVVKSTVVPGTTDGIVLRTIEEASGKKAGRDFGLCMNPEFLTEGVAVRDFMYPDRLVLGGVDSTSLDALDAVYASFTGVTRIRTNCKTAEMIKYTSNALLATMISFSNEIANMCAAGGGVDVVDVMQAIHVNSYLSSPSSDGTRQLAPITSFLEAGCGFGGSCLPKDVSALIAHARNVGSEAPVLEAVMQVNKLQYRNVIGLLEKHFHSLDGVRVAILGLAFKPDTDDMRESPAIPIIRELLARHARVTACDPAAIPTARALLDGEVVLSEDLAQVVADAQAVVLVTRWDEFKEVPRLLARLNPRAVLVDGRRLLSKMDVARYEGIGL